MTDRARGLVAAKRRPFPTVIDGQVLTSRPVNPPVTRAARPIRTGRWFAAAVVCELICAAGWLTAGGGVPPLPGVLVVTAVSAGVGWLVDHIDIVAAPRRRPRAARCARCGQVARLAHTTPSLGWCWICVNDNTGRTR